MKPLEAETRTPALYDLDVYRWAREQAAALERGDFGRLDLANLAEEIAALGRNERNTLLSHFTTVVEHLLKLERSRQAEPRRGWRATVLTHRIHLEDRLTPSLLRIVRERLEDRYRKARAVVLEWQADLQEADLPADCPYTLEQVLDKSWLPENTWGLDP